MEKSKIEEAATLYAIKTNGSYYYELFPNCDQTIGEIGENDFKAGAEWALSQPKDEWISVEDRLPEKHTYVLVDTPFCTNKSSVAYYNGIEWHSTDNMEVWNIKFWQPLPIKK